MALPYTQDIRNCFEIEDGFDQETFDDYVKKAEFATLRVHKQYEEETLPLLHLPESTEDLDAAEELATIWREKFDHIVVIGTGGSSSGGQCLSALRLKNEKPKLSFIDNLSVGPFQEFLDGLDLAKTGFIIISKSGSTGEILAQFLVILQLLIDEKLTENVITITENTNNPLRLLSEKYGMPCLEHDPKVGGRFSVLSIVGLLPAMMIGLDAKAIRHGANKVLQDVFENRATSAAAQGAIAAVQAYRHHYCQMQVFMPYIEQLKPLAFWHRQLWAESLGKNEKGQTPIDALGTVDQHSQLQLYLGGPKDKFFTLIVEDVFHQGPMVTLDLSDFPNLDYLQDKSLGDLLAAHQKATIETLANNARPTRLFKIEKLSEPVVGALLMHFMLETIIAADLMGLNAFDQPAVEQGKILVKEFLRAGRNLKLDAA